MCFYYVVIPCWRSVDWHRQVVKISGVELNACPVPTRRGSPSDVRGHYTGGRRLFTPLALSAPLSNYGIIEVCVAPTTAVCIRTCRYAESEFRSMAIYSTRVSKLRVYGLRRYVNRAIAVSCRPCKRRRYRPITFGFYTSRTATLIGSGNGRDARNLRSD